MSEDACKMMESRNNGRAKDLCLHGVFSPALDAQKKWYALNSVLCCGKPSMFCSTEFSKLFCDDYRQLDWNNVFGNDGAPACAQWFSSNGRHSEKVYVSSAFGLIGGILRQKSLHQVVARINSIDLGGKALILGLLTPPNSPPILKESPPIFQKSPPMQPGANVIVKKRETAVEEIREQDLTPAYEKRKIWQTVLEVKSKIDNLCKLNGQSLPTVLSECCRATGKCGLEAREVFVQLIDS